MITDVVAMMPSSDPTSPSRPMFRASWVISRDFSPSLRPIARARIEVRVSVPSPPIWMATRMTICPNRDHWAAVDTVVNPVTVTAEVAVNAASTKRVVRPGLAETGSHSSSANVRFTTRNTITANRAGEELAIRSTKSRNPRATRVSSGSTTRWMSPSGTGSASSSSLTAPPARTGPDNSPAALAVGCRQYSTAAPQTGPPPTLDGLMGS